MNPGYTRWATDRPPVAAALLAAVERTGAVLVTTSNLHAHGRPSGPMTPDSALVATDVKGRVRRRMWLDAVRRGRRARVVGDPDGPRSRAHLPDVVRTLAVLGTDERALGRSAPPVSGTPWWVLRSLGTVAPVVREIVDVRHQFDQPFVTDSTATTETFGLRPTPWSEAVAATVGRVPAAV